MLVNIRKVQGKDSIQVHCNIQVKIVDMVRDLPGYGTVWYEPTGMSRATNKFRVVFDSKVGNVSGWSSRKGN